MRLAWLSERLLEFIDSILPNDALRLAVHHLGHLEHSAKAFAFKYGMIIEVTEKGEVLQSWHSPDGSLYRKEHASGMMPPRHIYSKHSDSGCSKNNHLLTTILYFSNIFISFGLLNYPIERLQW